MPVCLSQFLCSLRPLCALLLVGAVCAAGLPAAAQAPTSTPIPVDLAPLAAEVEQDAAPDAAQDSLPTPTWTPTSSAPAQIEAITTANVRAQPDPNAERLGEIRAGEFYNALRRYYRWIEFQYVLPTGAVVRGWVFDELVTIVGDPNAIPVVDTLTEPTTSPIDNGATAVSQLTLTPGGLLTATVLARTNPAPVPGDLVISGGDGAAPLPGLVEATPDVVSVPVLPTFTYPPGVLAFAPTPAPPQPALTATPALLLTSSTEGGIPPVVPIAVLVVLGVFGLLISAVRG